MADAGKTEQPTQKKLTDARKQGRFPVSRELIAGAQFVLFVWLLTSSPALWLNSLQTMMRRLLAAAFAGPFSAGELSAMAGSLVVPVLWSIAKGGVLLVAGSLALQLASTGLGLSLSKLSPDLSRLNSFPRIAQMPRQNLGQALHALAALPVFAYLIAQLAARHTADIVRLTATGVHAAVSRVGSVVNEVLWNGAFLLLLLGLVDYYRQRSRWGRDLKMSRQEVQDEHKESEGNPQIKARIRRLMRDRSRRRMMKDVETATAVVVNPTHYAIALRYEGGEMPAPKVVAKGKNYLAARIRERALAHQVPIVENPPLARALYQSAAVGQEIPPHLFRAVAEVLAYIYRVMNRRPNLRR